MVLGVLTPAAALEAIDGTTLVLLFGVMGMGAFLSLNGFFEPLEERLAVTAQSPARLLAVIVWSAGLLSALITNDAVCILGAPLLVRIIRRCRLPALPFLLALATAANTGSVATLVGNPQNMLCGVLGGLSYRHHLALMAPVAVAGLAINHALLWWMFRHQLGSPAAPVSGEPRRRSPLSPRAAITLAVIAATVLAYSLGGNLAWTATAGFVALMLLFRRDTRQLWPRIDWPLLIFFAGLFVVVDGLLASGVPAAVFARFPLAGGDGLAGGARLAAIFLVGSNVVSNVPFILVIRDQMATLADPHLGWELLAMTSTFAGNLTLLGSAANIIVTEAASDVGGIGFFQYLRAGIPIAVTTTATGVLWLALVHGF